MHIIDDYDILTDEDKAIVAIMSVDKDIVQLLLSTLTEQEVTLVMERVSKLGAVASEVVEEVMSDINSKLDKANIVIGNKDTAYNLIDEVLPNLSEQIKNHISDDHADVKNKNVWYMLNQESVSKLKDFLQTLHPQTSAFILSKLSQEKAAELLSVMDTTSMLDIISRTIYSNTPSTKVSSDIEEVIQEEFTSRVHSVNNLNIVANIIQKLEAEKVELIYKMLQEENPEMAATIKSMVFTFKDIINVHKSCIPAIMQAVDNAQLYIALKDAPPKIKDIFLENMPKMTKKIAENEMQNLVTTPKQVRDARNGVSNAVIELIYTGDVFME